MGTVFVRTRTGGTFVQPEKTSFPMAKELFSKSKIEVDYSPDSYLRISLFGECSKFPSVSNSRVTSIPKQGLFKILYALQHSSNKGLVLSAISLLKNLRAVNVKHPAFAQIISASTMLWESARPVNFRGFDSSIDNRLFMYLFCGTSLRLHDTHNILKAACDWAQDIGVVKNDRHLDAIALRAHDFFDGPDATSFVFVKQDLVSASLTELIQSGIKNDSRKNKLQLRKPRTASEQTCFL